MTPASLLRIAIAKRVVEAHLPISEFAAAYLTGSAAQGIADDKSDIDMGLFFYELPDSVQLERAQRSLDPADPKWVIGSYADGEYIVSIKIDGIEVQYGVSTIACQDRYVGQIVAGEMGVSPEIKIAIGTLFAIPLHGAEHVERWRERFRTYPAAYRQDVLAKFLNLRPLHDLLPKLENRNAEMWIRRDLMVRLYDMFAALGALNEVWFSEFQFKRSDAWCNSLRFAPENLAERATEIATNELDSAMPVAIALENEVRALIEGKWSG